MYRYIRAGWKMACRWEKPKSIFVFLGVLLLGYSVSAGMGLLNRQGGEPPYTALTAEEGGTYVHGLISADTTWTAAGSPYRVIGGGVTVSSGATLTVEPGTTVLFREEHGLWVTGGNLHAVGTAEVPIFFGGKEDSPGWWKGIYVSGDSSVDLHYCEIAFAGEQYQAGVIKIGPGSLSLKHSTIRGTAGDGLVIAPGYASFISAGNIFQDNTRGVRVERNASFDDDTSEFSGNSEADLFLEGGSFSEDVVLHLHRDYSIFVEKSITVEEGAALTVNPGTVVKFAESAGLPGPLHIMVRGHLDVRGTVDAPVYFTDWRDDSVGGDANGDGGASLPAPGWWKGIVVTGSGSAGLEWCEMAYAGAGESSGLYKTGPGDMTMKNCTVRRMDGDGLEIRSSTGEIDIRQTTFAANSASGLKADGSPVTVYGSGFRNNGEYGIVHHIDYSPDYTANIFEDNAAGGISVYGTLTGDVTWRGPAELAVSESSLGVAEGAALTVEPGITVLFDGGRSIEVRGSLYASGTGETPIVFTAAGETPGGWVGVRILDDGSAELEHCKITYARTGLLKTGGGSLDISLSTIGDSSENGLRISGSTGDTSVFDSAVRNTRGEGTFGNGILVIDSAGETLLNNAVICGSSRSGLVFDASPVNAAGCIFRDNSEYGVRHILNNTIDYGANDFHDNGLEAIYIEPGILTESITWTGPAVMEVGNVTVGEEAVLTLEPGVTVKYTAADAIRYLNVKGELHGAGAPGSPVVFTSTTGVIDSWGGIKVEEEGSVELEHCEVAYARTGLSKTGGGDLALNYTVIRECANYGLSIGGSSAGSHEINFCSFLSNKTGVIVSQQSQAIILYGCRFEQNEDYGLWSYLSEVDLDARHCWWGDPAGPYHETDNPDSIGDAIRYSHTAGILFDPWLKGPAGLILSPRRSGTLVAGDTLRFRGSDPGIPQLSYNWDLGDGRSSNERHPGLVTFAHAGSYTVSYSASVQGPEAVHPDTRTFEVVDNTGEIPDLKVTDVSLPPELIPGRPAEISYTVENAGDGPAGPFWRDGLYLSTDPYLDVEDTCLNSVQINRVLEPGQSYQNTISIMIPPVVHQEAHHFILATNHHWHLLELHRLNNEYAVAVTAHIPDLERGVEHSASYEEGAVEHYYRMSAAAQGHILLNFSVSPGEPEVYVRFGALPSRASYDYRLSGGQLLIPAATAGDWYILLCGDMDEPGSYTLLYDQADIALSGISPEREGAGHDLNLTLEGAGFLEPLEVALLSEQGQPYIPEEVEVISFYRARASFPAGALPGGVYTVEVTRNGQRAELPGALEIVDGGEPNFEAGFILPAAFGYHIISTLYVEYANTGDASMPAPLLLVTASQGGHQRAFLTLEQRFHYYGAWVGNPEGFASEVQILAGGEMPGILHPGESRRVPVYWAGWETPWDFSYPPFIWTASVVEADNEGPVDWNDLKNELRPGHIGYDAWPAVWNNFSAMAGTTWGDYVSMLNRNAAYLHRHGQQVYDVDHLMALSLRAAEGLSPMPALAEDRDFYLQAPGLTLTFERLYAQSIPRRFGLGPMGYGWSHNWQYDLATRDDGSVIITDMTGLPRLFQPDRRYTGRFLAQPGDTGELRAFHLGYLLTEADGTNFYFQEGRLNYIEDAAGNRIACEYNGERLSGLTHSAGPALALEYNARGYIDTITDHYGRETRYEYEGEYMTSFRDYNGRVTAYTYNADPGASRHALSGIALPGGVTRSFTYNEQGYLSGTYTGDRAEMITFAYEEGGRVEMSDALGHTSRYYFDYLGRLVRLENPLGHSELISYDENGNLSAVMDAEGISAAFQYDGRGNLVKATDKMRRSTTFTYTRALNRLSSMTDPLGNRTDYLSDAWGNYTRIVYPDRSEKRWVYDGQGNATAWTNRRGAALELVYDSAGRVTAKTFPDGTAATYSYDRGNLVEMTDDEGTTTFSYDDEGDYITRIDYPAGRWLEFGYDEAGRRSSSTDHLGYRLNYEYDAAGRLERLYDTGGDIVIYAYDEMGRLERKTLGNGVYTLYRYDPAGRLYSQISYKEGGLEMSRFVYSYNRLGLRTSMETHYGTWSYAYDPAGRLTRAVLESTDPEIPDRELLYSYDAFGNRVEEVIDGQARQYAVNALNQYIQAGDYSYTYDLDGNLIRQEGPGGVVLYSYDDLNRLVGVTKGDENWEYRYDALGSLVYASNNGAETHYVNDPIMLGNLVGEYGPGGEQQARYTHGHGLVSSWNAVWGEGYFTFDPMGNTSEITGPGAALLNSYAYEPFGSVLAGSGDYSNPFAFMGELGVMAGPDGINYVRARHYEPSAGRFMQADPIGIAGGLNLYTYGENNPVNYLDPTGLSSRIRRWFMSRAGSTAPLVSEAVAVAEMAPDAVKAVEGMNNTNTQIESLNEMANINLEQPYRMPWEWREHRRSREDDRGYEDDRGRRQPRTPSPRPPRRNRRQVGGGGGDSAGAFDPNQKLGAAGFGQGNYVAVGRNIGYRVDFENLETATAPAQFVSVRDPLCDSLDLSTFELTGIGFGDVIIPVPEGRQFFHTVVEYDYKDDDYDLEIVVEIEVWLEGRTIHANFMSLDPGTGLPPADVNTGFLPPENETGRGQGYITYLVRPRPDLPSGTEIRNVAAIQFDFGDIIHTNQADPLDPDSACEELEALVTIDAAPPASRVDELPGVTSTRFVTVSWSGEDDAGGSGIAGYDIYVREEDGPWEQWLNRTTETRAEFQVKNNTTYSFYSIAVDNVGHVEDKAPEPETVTTVDLDPAEIGYGDINLDGSVNVLDAIMVIRHLLDLAPLCEDGQERADVNRDGIIDIEDVVRIMKKIVGLITLPLPGG